MSRLSRIGRTFTSCVGKTKTIDDSEIIIPRDTGNENSRAKEEDRQHLIDLPDMLSDEFYDRVRSDAVAVELLQRTKDEITGYVSVRNDAPEKRVVARYTTDDWETYQETSAEWFETVETQNCDKFRFTIPSSSWGDSHVLYLAVQYEVLDQQHWDNNHDNNYQVFTHVQ